MRSDFDKINQAVQRQDNDEILNLSTKLLDKYPSFTWFRLLRAMSLLSLKEFDKVIQDAYEILKTADAPCEECLPDCKTLHANAYDLLGRAHRGLQQLDQAENYFRKRLELMKNYKPPVQQEEPEGQPHTDRRDLSKLTEITIAAAALAVLFYVWEL